MAEYIKCLSETGCNVCFDRLELFYDFFGNFSSRRRPVGAFFSEVSCGFKAAGVGRVEAVTCANFSQWIGIFPILCSPVEKRKKERFPVQSMCVAVKQQPHLSLLSSPRLSPFSHSPLPSSFPNPPSDPRGKLSLFAEIGMSIPAPLTQVCSSPPHIGEMISGVISPPLGEAFIPPRSPPYLQARSGSLTGRLLLCSHSSTLCPLFTHTSSCTSSLSLNVSVHC